MFRNSLTVVFLNGVSLVLGLVRIWATARTVGPTVGMDAYVIGSIVFVLVTQWVDVSTKSAFVPVYQEIRARDEREAVLWFQRMLMLGAVAACMLCGVTFALSKPLVSVIAPSAEPQVLVQSHTVLEVLTPGVLASFVSTLEVAWLQCVSRFVVAGAVGVVQNVVVVGWLILHSGGADGQTLAEAFALGSIAQVLVVSVDSYAAGGLRRIPGALGVVPWRRFWRLWSASAVNLGIGQVTAVAERRYGSALPQGSLGALAYAYRVASAPVQLAGESLATVLYPRLAQRGVGAPGPVALGTALRLALGFVVLVLVSMELGSFTIIRFLFGTAHGFGFREALQCTRLLLIAAPFSVVSTLAVRALWAKEKEKLTTRASGVAVLANVLVIATSYRALGVAGLALGNLVANVLYAALLFFASRDQFASGDKAQDWGLVIVSAILLALVTWLDVTADLRGGSEWLVTCGAMFCWALAVGQPWWGWRLAGTWRRT